MTWNNLCYNHMTDGTGSEASTPPGSPDPERANVAGLEGSTEKRKKRRGSLSSLYHGPGGAKLSKEVLNNITLFQRKQKKVSLLSILSVLIII